MCLNVQLTLSAGVSQHFGHLLVGGVLSQSTHDVSNLVVSHLVVSDSVEETEGLPVVCKGQNIAAMELISSCKPKRVKYSSAARGHPYTGSGIISRQSRLWYFGGELAVKLRHKWYYFDPSCLPFLSPGSARQSTLLKDHLGIDKHSWEYEPPPLKGKALCGQAEQKWGMLTADVTGSQSDDRSGPLVPVAGAQTSAETFNHQMCFL